MFLARRVESTNRHGGLQTLGVRAEGGTGAWWRDAVIYRIHVRSFLDSTGDGIGDLAGVRAGLPYVRKLGADGIRLAPFHPSPRHDHGHDGTGRRAVDPVHVDPVHGDPVHGDPEEFGRVVAEARRLGLKVLIDMDPHRCAGEHPWFREALAAPPGAPARSGRRAVCGARTARDGVDRLLVGEVSAPAAAGRAARVRVGEPHQTFLFPLRGAPWDADAFRTAVDDALREAADAGSTVTWVLDERDRARAATRRTGGDSARGAARARAAALLLLALPGAVCIRQGEELGLAEVDPPDEALTGPVFRRTGGRRRVHDGCRVPLPWSGHASPFGFTGPESSAPPWLPQPGRFAEHTTDRALNDTGSFWHLYRSALVLRRRFRHGGDGRLHRLPAPPGVLALARPDGLVCAVNFGDRAVPSPVRGAPLLTSGPGAPGTLPADSAAWWARSPAGRLVAGPAGRGLCAPPP